MAGPGEADLALGTGLAVVVEIQDELDVGNFAGVRVSVDGAVHGSHRSKTTGAIGLALCLIDDNQLKMTWSAREITLGRFNGTHLAIVDHQVEFGTGLAVPVVVQLGFGREVDILVLDLLIGEEIMGTVQLQEEIGESSLLR